MPDSIHRASSALVSRCLLDPTYGRIIRTSDLATLGNSLEVTGAVAAEYLRAFTLRELMEIKSEMERDFAKDATLYDDEVLYETYIGISVSLSEMLDGLVAV